MAQDIENLYNLFPPFQLGQLHFTIFKLTMTFILVMFYFQLDVFYSATPSDILCRKRGMSAPLVMCGTLKQEVDTDEEAARLDKTKWCKDTDKYDTRGKHMHTMNSYIYGLTFSGTITVST